MAQDRLLSTQDAARMLHVCVGTIHRLINRDHLVSVKIGNRRLIRRSSVLRLMKYGVQPLTPVHMSRDYRGRFAKTPITQAVGSYYKKPVEPDSSALKILLKRLAEVDPELRRDLASIRF